MIKAVFFDIDGTLVSFKTHTVPRSAVDSIEALRKKGIKVFIATGRHLATINNLGTLQFDGYVTLNGSYCFAGKDQVIYTHAISEADVSSLIAYQQEQEEFPVILVQEKGMYLNYKNDRVEEVLRLLNFPEPPVCPFDRMPVKEVFQIIAFFGEHQEERIMRILPDCESTRWSPLFTDVVPAGSSKRVGIDKMIDYFGISLEETLSFGDGGNDIRMLKHTGMSVAMGNADQEVKDTARYVTSSVDEDGVFYALKHLDIL